MIKDFQTWANENDAHLKQSWMQSQQMGMVNGKAQSDGETFIAYSQRSYNVWKISPESQEDALEPIQTPEQTPAKPVSLWDTVICLDWSAFVWLKKWDEFIQYPNKNIKVIEFHVLRKKINLKVWDCIEINNEIAKLYIEDTKKTGIIDYIWQVLEIESTGPEWYVVYDFTIKNSIVEDNFNPLKYKGW